MNVLWITCMYLYTCTEKWAFFSHIFSAPPPGGDTWEILLANYKGRPMLFHYLYNWLLPLARFRKSRPQGRRKRWKKRKFTLPKYTSHADWPRSYFSVLRKVIFMHNVCSFRNDDLIELHECVDSAMTRLAAIWNNIGIVGEQRLARRRVVQMHLGNLLDEMVREEDQLKTRLLNNVEKYNSKQRDSVQN